MPVNFGKDRMRFGQHLPGRISHCGAMSCWLLLPYSSFTDPLCIRRLLPSLLAISVSVPGWELLPDPSRGRQLCHGELLPCSLVG